METRARNRAVLRVTLSILAVGAIGVLATSLAYTPEQIVDGGPLASFDLPACPGCALCGMSRAFCAASHLRFEEALRLNPLVLLLYPLVWTVAVGGPWIAATARERS
jgi:hypothetical protein